MFDRGQLGTASTHAGSSSEVAPGKRTLTSSLPPSAVTPAGGASPTYTVKAGDSLMAIAARLGTTVAALKALNADHLESYPGKGGKKVQGFRAGTVIRLPERGEAAATGAATTSSEAPAGDGGVGGSGAAVDGSAGGVLDAISGAVDEAIDTAGAAIDAIGDAAHDVWDLIAGGGGKERKASPASAAPASNGPASAAPASNGPASAAPASNGPASAAPASNGPASAAPASNGPAPVPGTSPFADLTPAQRRERLSTMQESELGTLTDKGMSTTGRDAAMARKQWLSVSAIGKAGRNKSGAAFTDSADDLVNDTSFTEDQGALIEAAKSFAAAPKELTPAQEKRAVIQWGNNQLSLDGVSLSSDLKARLERYVRFLAWADLVSGPSVIKSVMRSPKNAHRLSVAWMFNLGKNTAGGSTLHKAGNRKKLVDNLTIQGGTDLDGNRWLKDGTVDELKAKKDDDAALLKYIKTTAAPEANQVATQNAMAAEGYTDVEHRRPNILPGKGVSNHLVGEAVDMYPPYVLSNAFDPVIDAIAMYFGLWRPVKDSQSSPEHWHFERLGSPPGTEADDDGH